MIDLAPMRAVAVDPGRRTALVQPGVLLGERDRALQSHRMIVPAGTVSHAGVAGLTLGGGFGRRSHELAQPVLGGDLVSPFARARGAARPGTAARSRGSLRTRPPSRTAAQVTT